MTADKKAEFRSCVFCEHFEHVKGSGCETCGFDPYDQCKISERSGKSELPESQKDMVAIAMKCRFFEWHKEILEIQQSSEKSPAKESE